MERRDPIVLSCIAAGSGALEWRSPRPGGCVVCGGDFREPPGHHLFPRWLPGPRLERYSDSQGLRDSWAAGDASGRVIRAVLRKRP